MIKCNKCHLPVEGYKHSYEWTFVDGERYLAFEQLEISCGCVILGPDFDFSDCSSDDDFLLIKDKFTATTYLAFKDGLAMEDMEEDE